jgi:16S rRNA (guanine(1405)-N(7))-methyltransferase
LPVNAEGVLEPEVAEIVRGLRESRRYRSLSEPALIRVARWSLRSGRGRQSALKAAKRKLHQVYGAYLAPSAIASAERVAGRLAAGLIEEEQRSLCLEVLRQHASTAERLPFLERFYADLLEGLPPVGSVVDLACGLNPFAIAWMGLPAGATYLAVDIDQRLAAALNRLDSSLGVSLPLAGSASEGVAVTGLAHDLAGGSPPATGDLVLLLKAIPCLEQQEPGAGSRLLRSLDAPCVVVSFPARSLGGRERGMRQTYDRMLTKMVEGTGRTIERLEYPTETVYRLLRRP